MRVIFALIILIICMSDARARNADDIYTSYNYEIAEGSLSYFCTVRNINITFTAGENGLFSIIYGVPLKLKGNNAIYSIITLLYKKQSFVRKVYIIVLFGSVKIQMIKGRIIINKGCFAIDANSYCILDFPKEYYIYEKINNNCFLEKITIKGGRKISKKQNIFCPIMIGR